MEEISLRELIADTKGTLLGEFSDLDTKITGVRSDNRQCGPGDVFFAVVGEKVDGHRFVKAALEAGAAGAVVSKEPEERIPGKFYVKVPDTIAAAGDLAAAYRRKFRIPVIGVTGSVGKTTMKDMIAAVLSQKYRVLKTEANFNNNIGLPRTIFRMDHTTQMAVLEMGMNHMGEISYLVHIAQPTCAVITNIGEAHIGNLGSRENIFRAKSEIFEGLQEGGFAVMNADDDYLPRLRENRALQEKFTFTWVGENEKAEYRAVNIDDTLAECMKFTAVTPGGTFDVNVPALGRHMIYPCLVAAALGQHFGESNEEIVRGIASYQATAMRMETYRNKDHNLIIYNDAYNANPESMKAGLTTLAHTKGVRHVAVLGDMLELGSMEEQLHREVGRTAADAGIDTLITIGRRALWIADEARQHGLSDVRSFETSEEAKETVRRFLTDNTAIYFKASHLIALEKLADWCRQQAEQM